MSNTRQEDAIIFNRITKTTRIKVSYFNRYTMPNNSDKIFIIFHSLKENVVIYDVPNSTAELLGRYADNCKHNADQAFDLDIITTHLWDPETKEAITKYRLVFYQGTNYYRSLEFLRFGSEPNCEIN